MTNYCPACERGALVSAAADEGFQFDGVQLTAHGIEFSECPVCGEEVVLEDQAKRNDARFADAKHLHLDTLTTAELTSARHSLGLTQAQAAMVFGGGANAFSKYERAEVMQSKPMDLLIRVALNVPEARRYLFARANVAVDSGWHDEVEGGRGTVVKFGKRAKRSDRVAAYHTAERSNRDGANEWAEVDAQWVANA